MSDVGKCVHCGTYHFGPCDEPRSTPAPFRVSPQEDGAPAFTAFTMLSAGGSHEDPDGQFMYVADHERIVARLTAENGTLAVKLATANERDHEGHAAHAASFGALAEISQLTALGGEVNDYGDVVKAVAALRERAERAEREAHDLRREWWMSHGCGGSITAMYGDDGEMQCHACMIDFKTFAPNDINARLANVRALHSPSAAPTPETT